MSDDRQNFLERHVYFGALLVLIFFLLYTYPIIYSYYFWIVSEPTKDWSWRLFDSMVQNPDGLVSIIHSILFPVLVVFIAATNHGNKFTLAFFLVLTVVTTALVGSFVLLGEFENYKTGLPDKMGGVEPPIGKDELIKQFANSSLNMFRKQVEVVAGVFFLMIGIEARK